MKRLMRDVNENWEILYLFVDSEPCKTERLKFEISSLVWLWSGSITVVLLGNIECTFVHLPCYSHLLPLIFPSQINCVIKAVISL